MNIFKHSDSHLDVQVNKRSGVCSPRSNRYTGLEQYIGDCTPNAADKFTAQRTCMDRAKMW
jgi:hypothetical protein